MRENFIYITAFYPYHNPVRQVGSYQLELENEGGDTNQEGRERGTQNSPLPHEHIKNTPTCGKILTEI